MSRLKINRFTAILIPLKCASPRRYTILNDSANFFMLLFCKQINT